MVAPIPRERMFHLRKVIYSVLIVIFLAIFAFSAWQLYQIFDEYKAGTDTYAALEQYVSVPDSTSTEPATGETGQAGGEKKTDNTVWPVVDFEALQEINPDIVGWIYIEDTEINYPIVQGDDNTYYLKHLFDGTANSSGSIFLDAYVEPDFSGQNSILHGHHMKNGSMFGGLKYYKEQSYYDEHSVALLLTPEANYKVLLFSGYVVSTAADAWDTEFTDSQYAKWLKEISGKSCFESDIVPETTDRILTLSTCSYEFNDARFILHGIITQ